jgi:hypothetical protein
VLRPALTFTPGKGWTLQAWGGYQSRFTNEQFIDAPRGSLNFDFEKKLSAGWTVYRFGKTIKDQRHYNANGAQSEMNRVGN